LEHSGLRKESIRFAQFVLANSPGFRNLGAALIPRDHRARMSSPRYRRFLGKSFKNNAQNRAPGLPINSPFGAYSNHERPIKPSLRRTLLCRIRISAPGKPAQLARKGMGGMHTVWMRYGKGMRPSLNSFAIKYRGMPYGEGGWGSKKREMRSTRARSDFPAPFLVQIALNPFRINTNASKSASIFRDSS
jgi:hypothetical protein